MSICSGKNSSEYISPDDMGFLYGFSVFETFAVNDKGTVFRLENHIERLMRSAAFFGIHCNLHKEELLCKVISYIDENMLSNIILRVTLSAGNEQKGVMPNLFFSCRKNIYTIEKLSKGCKLCLTDVRKSENSQILRHKTSNYLENYLVLRDAANKGFDDVLFMNSVLHVTETAKCNIFFVKDSIIHTPDIRCGLLPGIIREWIIERAVVEGIECREGFFGINDFYDADEVFITNSAFGIMHVVSIDENNIKSEGCGTITQLMKTYL